MRVQAAADAAAHALAEEPHHLLGDAPPLAHEERMLGGEAAPGGQVRVERALGHRVQRHDAVLVALAVHHETRGLARVVAYVGGHHLAAAEASVPRLRSPNVSLSA
jgi:hypothetical protein